MDNELTALPTLLSQGIIILGILLAMLSPIGLTITSYGLAREKHRWASLRLMLLMLPVATLSFYLFGWMIYHAFETGPGITGGFGNVSTSVPWSQSMGTGVAFNPPFDNSDTMSKLVAFIIFAWFASCLLAGATLERIRGGGLILLSVVMTALFFSISAAWGWSQNGWMVSLMGFHDAFGAGAIHTLGGGFTLGVLVVLRARIVNQNFDGHTPPVQGHSPGMVIAGRLLMLVGLFGVGLATTNPVSNFLVGEQTYLVSNSIYGTPISLSVALINIIMAMAGGLMMGYVLTRGNLQWMVTLPVAAVIAIAPGADFYHPLESFIIALFFTWICLRSYHWLETRIHIDDVTGTVALHGFAGFWGLVLAGILLWGYPASTNPEFVNINPFGQTGGAVLLFWLLGYLPGYVCARVLNYFGVLRIPKVVEISGQDINDIRSAEQARYNQYLREKAYIKEIYED